MECIHMSDLQLYCPWICLRRSFTLYHDKSQLNHQFGRMVLELFPRMEQANPSISVKNRLILHSEPRVLYSCDEFSWHHLGSSDIFPLQGIRILLMEEIRLIGWYGKYPIICSVSYIQTVVSRISSINSIHIHSWHFSVNEFPCKFGGIHVVISENGTIFSLPNPDAPNVWTYLPVEVENGHMNKCKM